MRKLHINSLTYRTVITSEDMVLFKALLGSARLPVADLGQPCQQLHLFLSGGEVIGTGGLELHGDQALIRSVSVITERRGRGYGEAIVRKLMQMSSNAGAASCHLLTTGAELFFQKMGFSRLDRGLAPEAIRSSTEFSSVCPSSAVLMHHPC